MRLSLYFVLLLRGFNCAAFVTPRTTPIAASNSALFSLSKLVDDLVESDRRPRTIFVGGKGGVGKTSLSSALAVQLASQHDVKVLIVSTDPAHSLGDALDVNLRVTHENNRPIQMTDPITSGRLYAAEVDAAAALESFRESLQAFDVNRLADALGVSTDLLQSFGLEEFSSLLNNPPPGLDELVALANVLDPEAAARDFDIVVVDTAPTGHTLRLLALPQFLDGFLGKLIQLRLKLTGLATTLQALFGSDEAQQRKQTLNDALDQLQNFKTKMGSLKTTLQDASQTSFMVVSVPTRLSVAESKRLMTELNQQHVAVTDVVVNQCVVTGGGAGEEDNDAIIQYYNRRKTGQERWLNELQDATTKISNDEGYKSNQGSDETASGPIAVTQVPFMDVELVGVPALAYLGRECYVDNPNFARLMSMDDADNDGEPKVVICGGKGGVGKTTTSASLAVSMAAQGHNVALISTDPAHSLGDAIDLNLAGGALQDCPLLGVPPTDGTLSVLEVDPSKSLSQFKDVIDQVLGSNKNDNPAGGGSDIANTLRDFGEVFDTLPAGTDEVVALAKVINLVKNGGFDRIVLDTAPTGHTLRMLSTPGFIAELIDRVLVLAQKVNSNAAVKMLINSAAASSGGSQEDMESAASAAKSKLIGFQLQMYDLEDMFANADQTEFLVVTVPTELAVRESVRLLNDLTFEAPDMPIKVRNVVANQVLRDGNDDVTSFLTRVQQGQESSIRDLEQATSSMSESPTLTKVPYLDTEPRGVFGLKVLADALMKQS